ncbi:M15 family metallopeptidase [Lachnospiraceae bacterium 66-29]
MNNQEETGSHNYQVQREPEEKDSFSNPGVREPAKEDVSEQGMAQNKDMSGHDQESQADQSEQNQEQSQDKRESSTEPVSNMQETSAFSIAEIQVMEAGSIVDVSSMEAQMLDSLFYSEVPGEKIVQRIAGISYQENDNISMEELRYLRVLHMGFDGQTHIGELLVHESIAEDILEIMAALYENQYPIEKMLLVDEYGADDEVSMQENNTSAFNYREIAGTSRLSQHSLGLAIDINPKFNPYVKEKDGELTISPANAADYADRTQEFEYKIDENDLCYQLFTAHGFTWGGSWNSVKDYQHFEK